MKLSKKMITLLALCASLSLTACAGKEAAGNSNSQTTNAASDAAASIEALNAKLDALYQQENQLFADHKEAWDKAFGMMDKNSVDPIKNYVDHLADTITSNKASFTTDEYETISKDMETIRSIEDEMADIQKKLQVAAPSDTEDRSETTSASQKFSSKAFSGKDFDGNTITEDLFSKNAVTALNFWFTGCKPCVTELSKLDELNETIKAMGGEVVGINTETFDSNQAAIEEAKKVLESQGAKYRNLSLASDSEAGQYAANIMAFPTTILVDRNGNVVGEPLLGGVDDQANYDVLMKQIQSVIDADRTNK